MKFSRLLISILKLMPKALIKPIAFKYVAGEAMPEALTTTKALNQSGIKATLDILGESVFTENDAKEYTTQYIKLVEAIADEKIASGVSVKPTAFGLCVSYELALQNFKLLLNVAKRREIFIRIDMEDSPHTDKTIQLYNELKKEYSRVGIVFQAYLNRTTDDISHLTDADFNIRICKGIYSESEEIAIKSYQGIVDNYLRCLELALGKRGFVGIATHDEVLVKAAMKMVEEKNVPKNLYEFQMLYGVLPNLRDQIKAEGHPLRVYIPYGKDWYPYSIRRMYENPMIAFHVAKALFVDSFIYLYRKVLG